MSHVPSSRFRSSDTTSRRSARRRKNGRRALHRRFGRLFGSIALDAARRRRDAAPRTAVAAGLPVLVVGHQQYKGTSAACTRAMQPCATRANSRRLNPITRGDQRWFGGKLDYPVNVPAFRMRLQPGPPPQVRDKAAAISVRFPRPMGLFIYGDDHGSTWEQSRPWASARLQRRELARR